MKEEMAKRIHAMANQTWDAIGGDCLVDENGNMDESASWPREAVAEMVGDAGYMGMYGGDKEAYEAWKALPWEERQKVLLEAFQFETYGW